MMYGSSALSVKNFIGNVLFPCLLRSHGEHPSIHSAWLDAAPPSQGDIMFKKFAITIIAAFALVVGLITPAHADTTATFTASWNSTATANAEATAVAIAGADATGKLLLEEEKARSPHKVLRTLKPPTEAEVNNYGTPVNSREQAQSVLRQEVKHYDKQLNAAKVKVAKLKQKIKFYKHNPQKIKKLKKQLRKAQKYLKQVQTSWRYKPLLKLNQGVCGRNTGRTGHMILESFVDCILASQGEQWKALGWVPELRQAVIVGVKRTDGSYEAGCNNFWFFDIPEGTPDESMVIVVKAFAKVILDVAVNVHVKGDFTLYGEMRQDGKVCDTDSKTVHVDKMVEVGPIRVTETDTDRAMEFGQQQVQANAEARAKVQEAVAADLKLSLREELHLSCAAPATGTVQIDRMNDVNQSTVDDKGVLHKSQTPGDVDYMVPAGQQATIRIDCGSCSSVVFASNGSKTLTVTGDGKVHTATFTYTASTEPGTDTITATNSTAANRASTNITINKIVSPPK